MQLMSHVGTPLCVSCVRGTAAGSPYAYRIPQLSGGTEGQALPQGPGSSPVGCYGETCSGGTRPTSCHTPIHGTRGAGPSFTLRPYVRAGAGFTTVQPPEAIIRGLQTSPGSGTQLRPRKGNSEVGTDLGPQVAPSQLVGTCTEAWRLPVVPSEVWQSGGLCPSLLLPSPVSPGDRAFFLARSRC